MLLAYTYSILTNLKLGYALVWYYESKDIAPWYSDPETLLQDCTAPEACPAAGTPPC